MNKYLKTKQIEQANRRIISNTIYIIVFSIPILRYYDLLGSLGLESFLWGITLICFFILMSYESQLVDEEINKSKLLYLCFIIWSVCISLVYEFYTKYNIYSIYSHYTVLSYIMPLVAVFIVYEMLDGRLDATKAIDIYGKFVFCVVAVYIIQWILKVFGRELSFKMPFLHYSDSYYYLNARVFGMNSGSLSSVFSERAHFAEYIVPYIAICLYSKDLVKIHRIGKAVFLSIITVSTASGNGIIVVLIEWVCFLLFFGKLRNTTKILLILLGVLVSYILYNELQKIEVFNDLFNRLFVNNTGNEYLNTKADYRVYRGFDYFRQLPHLQQLIGVGYLHMSPFARINGLTSQYDSNTSVFEFFNTVSQVLLYFGLIGFAFFSAHLWNLYKSKSYSAKGLTIITVALWCSSQMLFNNTYIMYTLLIIICVIQDTDLATKSSELNGKEKNE